jgi:hypothetical protein
MRSKISQPANAGGRIPFTFSITSTAGLRGTCLLLAVPVDAPVGVHLGQNEIGGDGANLGPLRVQLTLFF